LRARDQALIVELAAPLAFFQRTLSVVFVKSEEPFGTGTGFFDLLNHIGPRFRQFRFAGIGSSACWPRSWSVRQIVLRDANVDRRQQRRDERYQNRKLEK